MRACCAVNPKVDPKESVGRIARDDAHEDKLVTA